MSLLKLISVIILTFQSLSKEVEKCSNFFPYFQASELSAWEEMESTGNWDIDEETTNELLKEKRRIERERKLLENMQKRMDKDRHRIASKIS